MQSNRKITGLIKHGYVDAAFYGKDMTVTYIRPKRKTDLKRIGRELSIKIGNATMVLNGKHLRNIKNILSKVGEI